jgi:hypothetical protein
MAAVKAAFATGWRRCGFLLVLLSAGAPALAQDYQTPFVEGMRARDQKNWSDAISNFQAAAAARSGEAADRVPLYGMRTALYLPHYYLGEAYANSGNCVAALEQFAESERQGVVQKTGEYKGLLNLRARCQGMVAPRVVETPRPAAPAPLPTVVAVVAAPQSQAPAPSPTENAQVQQTFREAQSEVARAEAAATAEAKLHDSSAGSGFWQKDPSLGAREKKAKEDLAAARGALEEGKARGDISRLRSARDAAARASQEFGDLQRLVSDGQKIVIASQVTAVPSPLLRDINSRIKSAGQLLADASRSRSLPAEAAGPKADLERLLGKSQKLNSATPSEQKAFADQLKSATLRFTDALRPTPAPVAAAVPPRLLEGASAYFAGDYARAALTLESAPDSSDRHAVAEARLIRSAARYALYVIGGAKDSGLQQRAAQDASDCRRLDPGVSPSRKVFSPRFVQFFAEVTEKTSRSAS